MMERAIRAVEKLSSKLSYVVLPTGTKVTLPKIENLNDRPSFPEIVLIDPLALRRTSPRRRIPLQEPATTTRRPTADTRTRSLTSILLPPVRRAEEVR